MRDPSIPRLGDSIAEALKFRQLEGRPYATIWDDVRLPNDVKTLPGPEPEFTDIIRSVAVEDLRRLCAAPAQRVTS